MTANQADVVPAANHDAAESLSSLRRMLNHAIRGKEEVVELVLACLLARGHLLLEDLPGMGKTTLSHALADVLGLSWKRVQFTSDLLPADILGVSVYDRTDASFSFHPRSRSSWRRRRPTRSRSSPVASLPTPSTRSRLRTPSRTSSARASIRRTTAPRSSCCPPPLRSRRRAAS